MAKFYNVKKKDKTLADAMTMLNAIRAVYTYGKVITANIGQLPADNFTADELAEVKAVAAKIAPIVADLEKNHKELAGLA